MTTIDVLKSYFNNSKITDVGDELLRELKEQNLLQYLYYTLENNESVTNYYLKCMLIQHKYLQIQKELSQILSQNKIKHAFLKGSVLCTLYPDVALRTRGDIDLLILDNKFDEAKAVLITAGYNEGIPSYHHTEFKKAGLEIELHNHLLSLNYKNYTYFDNILKLKHICGSLYELDENIHYLFEIWHLHKHVISGEGLRYLLDFYYMQKNWKLDFAFINSELEKYGLARFHNSIINGVYILTGEKLNGFTSENDDVLINYLESSGIHGRLTNPLVNNMSANYKSKFSYMCDRLFLPNKLERQDLYPNLGKSILLYPLLLIHRGIHLTFTRMKSLRNVIKTKTNTGHKDLLQEIGVVKL